MSAAPGLGFALEASKADGEGHERRDAGSSRQLGGPASEDHGYATPHVDPFASSSAACQEENDAIPNILAGARMTEPVATLTTQRRLSRVAVTPPRPTLRRGASAPVSEAKISRRV